MENLPRKAGRPPKQNYEPQATVDVISPGSAYSGVPVIHKGGVVTQEVGSVFTRETHSPENGNTLDASNANKTESQEDLDSVQEDNLECPPGFEPISTAPKTGDRIVVSETGQDAIAVFWRERRVVNKEKLRYEKKGDWTGVLSRLDIDFEPKFWRKYSAADYIPVPRTA